MFSKIIRNACWTTILIAAISANGFASDLKDEFEDDGIEAYDSLEEPSINIQYIKRSAKAGASSGYTYEGQGDVAIGGFINKPGAEVGDVIIIFDGDDISAVTE